MKAASGNDRMADGKFASRFLQVTAKRQDAKVTIAIQSKKLFRSCVVNGIHNEIWDRTGRRY